jgi:tetratricopeptide (TPR) repeat protein
MDMNQKRYWICLSVLAGLSMMAWAEDGVTIKGMLWGGRLSGYKNFQVEMVKSSGGKKTTSLLDVTSIECNKYPEFSQAETARTKKKYTEALDLYKKAASKSRAKWLKALARDRSYQILVAQGEIGKATTMWLDMVDSSTDQKTALDWVPVLSGTPSKRKAGDAIQTLQTKAKKLKDDPKNKAYRASVLALLAEIQTASGDASGAEKTQTELVAAGGGKATKKVAARKRPALSRGKNDSRLNPARDLLDAKQYDEALAEIHKMFSKVPYREKPAAYVLLGQATRGKYQAEGKKDKSLLTQAGKYFVYAYALEKNAEKKPSIGEALYCAMQVCTELGDTTGASAAAQALEQLCGEDNPWVKKSKLKQ